jgi:hypothetical protein
VHELIDGVLGAFWPPERALVDRGYADIPFPFTDLVAPPLAMEARWTLHDLVGFVATWSASAAYRRAHGTDPAASLLPALATAWGDPGTSRLVRWPLTVLAGVRAGGEGPGRTTGEPSPAPPVPPLNDQHRGSR